MLYSLDFAIKTHKEDLKRIITKYSEELINNDFKYIYRKLKNFYSTATFTAAFTALLLKNNINPLYYIDEVPEYFAYGLNIKEFIIPNNIIEISPCAFEDCSILTNITIGSGTTLIYNSVFSNCERLASITIPKSVVYIGQAAFRNCSKLKDVYYEGSEEDWKNIEIEWWCNELLRNANIHYNS